MFINIPVHFKKSIARYIFLFNKNMEKKKLIFFFLVLFYTKLSSKFT